MPTFPQSIVEKGSDTVQDFLWSTCEEDELKESADYYCESCVMFYCRKCILLHSQLFKKHCPHGRSDMKKWPVAKKVEDFLLKCDVHKEENLQCFAKTIASCVAIIVSSLITGILFFVSYFVRRNYKEVKLQLLEQYCILIINN
ncbi:hypothetical protein DPMN_076940 [Dreissena polymorpha]|uniref:B box-type domain-containing protein n=1 Tax=Dreissena polymorpha TaxID=45954 RepID=A0A9D4BQX5_DREPO|nr:hypothetical protein DPMN_076940 [Dreissena polymorpha]